MSILSGYGKTSRFAEKQYFAWLNFAQLELVLTRFLHFCISQVEACKQEKEHFVDVLLHQQTLRLYIWPGLSAIQISEGSIESIDRLINQFLDQPPQIYTV